MSPWLRWWSHWWLRLPETPPVVHEFLTRRETYHEHDAKMADLSTRLQQLDAEILNMIGDERPPTS